MSFLESDGRFVSAQSGKKLSESMLAGQGADVWWQRMLFSTVGRDSELKKTGVGEWRACAPDMRDVRHRDRTLPSTLKGKAGVLAPVQGIIFDPKHCLWTADEHRQADCSEKN